MRDSLDLSSDHKVLCRTLFWGTSTMRFNQDSSFIIVVCEDCEDEGGIICRCRLNFNMVVNSHR